MTAMPSNGDPLSHNSMQQQQQGILSSFVNELSFWEPPMTPERLKEDAMLAQKASRNDLWLRSTSSERLELQQSSSRKDAAARSQSTSSVQAISEPLHWKVAVDAVSGRKYYYDSVTRNTQWEKPSEVRAWEKHLKREQRNRDLIFFRSMEDNIRNSLFLSELIPGVPALETTRLGPPMEPFPTPPTGIRVRTISAMNEHLLSEVNNSVPSDTSQEEEVTVTVQRGPPIKGRPPLPKNRPAQQQETAASVFAADSLELSPKPAAFKREQSEFSLPEDSLAGEFLLDGPTPDQGAPPESSDKVMPLLRPPADRNVAPTTVRGSAAPAANNGSGNHLRRNTAGTINLLNTMDNPDVNATIKCVCGVYRAHIVQSAVLKSKHSPVSVSTVNVNLEVFRDDYESGTSTKELRIPKLEAIESFYQEFYRRSQMEHDTIIMSLIYVERIIKETNGALVPTLENWRSVLFSCMILASKVWDDLSMWNIDFSNVSHASGISAFSLQRINQLELALLTSLSFSVKVPASEYAKYYFLIRTMLIRSGLLASMAPVLNKADAKMLETRTAEYEVTNLSGRGGRRARSVDWSWMAAPDEDNHASVGPVLKDKVCLEQLVSTTQ